jgi:signal peptidase II
VKSRTHLQELMLKIAIGVIALDLLTKVLAVRYLENRPNVVLIPAIFGENAGPLLQFTFIRNSGAAFSLGASTTWVFTILALIISFYIYRTGKKVVRLSWAICLGAMLGGAIGNLIDRLFRSPGVFRGAVVDFIQIPYWAIFNIADMGVSISAVVIAFMALFGKDPYQKSEK